VRAAVCLVPGLTAFWLGWWQISARSFSEDEAATMMASRRPLAGLGRMLPHVDAVHGVYYVLIHEMLFLGGSEGVARLPSAVAEAVAAAVLAALGARLAGGRAGLAAGLLYAVSPSATSAAQTARPFALATALVVVTCYRFVIFAGTGGRWNGAAYAVALSLTGWVDILAMLVVVANSVTLLWMPPWRPRRRGFAAATGAAVIAVLPLAVLDLSQFGDLHEKPPGALLMLGVAALLAVAGALTYVALRPGGSGPPPAGGSAVAKVAAPWLMLPPVILAGVSAISPIWALRYLLFCLPALALLAVAALSRLPARQYVAATALAATAALAAQALVRPAHASDDLRAVSQMLAVNARPGDAVVFADAGRRLMKAAYPAGFVHLRDIALDTSPAPRGAWFGRDASALHGRDVSQPVLARRLAGVDRVWAIRYATAHPAVLFGAAPDPRVFCALRTWQFAGATATLYQRCPGRGWARAHR
jgi:mannosyltransferase